MDKVLEWTPKKQQGAESDEEKDKDVPGLEARPHSNYLSLSSNIWHAPPFLGLGGLSQKPGQNSALEAIRREAPADYQNRRVDRETENEPPPRRMELVPWARAEQKLSGRKEIWAGCHDLLKADSIPFFSYAIMIPYQISEISFCRISQLD